MLRPSFTAQHASWTRALVRKGFTVQHASVDLVLSQHQLLSAACTTEVSRSGTFARSAARTTATTRHHIVKSPGRGAI